MSHYLISEASRLVDEESHVLRYWEEELALKIPRNDLGHRYYTEVQLEIFRTIKDLKQQGYQLKEIKQYLDEMEKDRPKEGTQEENPEEAPSDDTLEIPPVIPILPPENEENTYRESPRAVAAPAPAPMSAGQQARVREFRELMTDILADAMEAGFDRVTDDISDQVSRRVIKEMNYLDREREEREEERFRDLDEAIRSRQRRGKYRAEAAATVVDGKEKKSRWKKRKVH